MGMEAPPTLVWLRRDLRLADHAPFAEAAERGAPVLPVFVEGDPDGGRPGEAPGRAAAVYRKESLRALSGEIGRRGGRLLLRRGRPEEVLPSLARETGALAVLFTSHPDPLEAQLEERVVESLCERSVPHRAFPWPLLHDPASLRTSSGGPYRVFTPFWNALRRLPPPGEPLPAPARLPAPRPFPEGLSLDEAIPDPVPDWGGAIRSAWKAGEEGAEELLASFLDGPLSRYPAERDLPAAAGTSRLSCALHHGEITPRRVFRAVAARAASGGSGAEEAGGESFLRQVGWRDFAHHLLHHYPRLPCAPLRPPFAAFPWRSDAAGLASWKRGETGFPLVDAGMRELWRTGWMHNRVRMVAASFLVKDLLLPWTAGAAWFLDTLCDGDLANNSFGWQWVAGCGADAAPFFRVFNPAGQGERFDGAGEYVRRWVPELSRLPDRWIHRPHEAPGAVLREAGVRPGESYPRPLVEHGAARERALHALSLIQGTRGEGIPPPGEGKNRPAGRRTP
jgi:deoxyribodipyrimidine photo-lyase